MSLHFKPRNVAVALRNGTLSNANQVLYLAIAFGYQALVGAPRLASAVHDPATAISWSLHLGTAFAALGIAYRANGGRTGRDFVQRFFCISTVLWLWLLLGWCCVYAVCEGVLLAVRGVAAASAFGFSGSVHWVLLVVLYATGLILLRHYMRIAAARGETDDLSTPAA